MIKKYMQDDITMFDTLKKNITYQTLVTDTKGKDSSFFSYSLKEIAVLLIILIFPTICLVVLLGDGLSNVSIEDRPKAIVGNILLMAILLLSITFYIMVKHIYRSRYLNRFRSRITIVGLLEISVVSYASIVLFNIFPHINFVLLSLILISYFVLSLWLIKVILDVKIKETLNKSYGQNIKISRTSRYLSSYPAVVLAIVVFAAYFYRITKSAFILTQNESPVSFLYNIVGGVGFLLIGLSISLLPTLLFDGELFIRGKILQNHSEYFRKEYEFTKEEWYGE